MSKLSAYNKLMNTFHADVAFLAESAHKRIMQAGMQGDYRPITVCRIEVTCADDLQSVRNRFSNKMRTVPLDEIAKAIADFR